MKGKTLRLTDKDYKEIEKEYKKTLAEIECPF